MDGRSAQAGAGSHGVLKQAIWREFSAFVYPRRAGSGARTAPGASPACRPRVPCTSRRRPQSYTRLLLYGDGYLRVCLHVRVSYIVSGMKSARRCSRVAMNLLRIEDAARNGRRLPFDAQDGRYKHMLRVLWNRCLRRGEMVRIFKRAWRWQAERR